MRYLHLVIYISILATGCDSLISTVQNEKSVLTTSVENVNVGPEITSTFQWTDLHPSTDSRIIYVSQSSGNDTNDCLSSARACASPSRGISLLRNGYPDWLLFKRGDRFYEPLSKTWGLSGRSNMEPMVLSTYGNADARPEFRSGTLSGFETDIHQPIKNLRIVGLAFLANTRNPNSAEYVSFSGAPGIRLMALGYPINDIIIEGCEIAYYTTNLIAQSDFVTPFTNLQLRANNIHDSWTVYGGPNHQGFSEGMYIEGVDNFLLEQNIVDHNGGIINYPKDHRFKIPYDVSIQEATVTWYNHQVYSDSHNTNVRIFANIFANGDGVQCRSGCEALNNLFIRNINSLTGGRDDNLDVPGGYKFNIQNNIFMEGTDFPNESATPGPRGNGISLTNTSDEGAYIANNLFINDISASPYGSAIHLSGEACNPTYAPWPCPIRKATLENNIIYNWRGGIQVHGKSGNEVLNTSINNNLVQTPLINVAKDLHAPLTYQLEYGGSNIVWKNNQYYSDGASPKWFNIGGQDVDFTTWGSTISEQGALIKQYHFQASSIKFENVVSGNNLTYEEAWKELRNQTPWNWKFELETIFLLNTIHNILGI